RSMLSSNTSQPPNPTPQCIQRWDLISIEPLLQLLADGDCPFGQRRLLAGGAGGEAAGSLPGSTLDAMARQTAGEVEEQSLQGRPRRPAAQTQLADQHRHQGEHSGQQDEEADAPGIPAPQPAAQQLPLAQLVAEHPPGPEVIVVVELQAQATAPAGTATATGEG